ncbi:hypothetical protein A2239_03340 [Candidatus Uhrbacteria bacterium RIFOXYA2_FULL_40_9]|nr:MAG: Cobalt-zinc-cadmium resistance protein CzcD [Candidatus Uhrbacteria bacterium GW2011_GWF2_40_263]OGL91931.1 MAG: hypothetical protein A2239_03340 [Candidatus Uhrbacteria bacterium RIFOXYA2_FULL_40_9]OGL96544.1 MAG: hypothetical protein A2332_01030 [Candidatus Uhrbacteria bacterium RIFOXYB2_FULL_41_18]HBK34608.1 hypothetical protein [Candidatus Uhrbacteria bacterium]HCB55663.1 hypothetical protein [Candidatus Uhrbacteria bacterium]
MMPIKSFFRGPYGVMAIVLVMYFLKVTVKLTVGYYTGSQMITGDGWHNTADIFEALMVVATVMVASRPSDGSYPFGRKNLESLFGLVVGFFLFLMGLSVAGKSVLGITLSLSPLLSWKTIAQQYFQTEAVPEYNWWVALIILVSAILSLVVSRLQIVTGKRSGHESLVADGEETASDGRLEFAVLAGVVGQLLFGWSWLEYPFSLFVAYLMICTAWEIFWKGMDAVLQKSIGAEHEKVMKDLALRLHGVVRISDPLIDGSVGLKTFRVGPTVIVILKLISDEPLETTYVMKRALATKIVAYLREQGFMDAKYYIRTSPTPALPTRVAYSIVREGAVDVIAPNLIDATHVRICDLEHGVCYRWKDVDIGSMSLSERMTLLREKHVSALCEFPSSTYGTATYLVKCVQDGIILIENIQWLQIQEAPSFNPKVLGID